VRTFKKTSRPQKLRVGTRYKGKNAGPPGRNWDAQNAKDPATTKAV